MVDKKSYPYSFIWEMTFPVCRERQQTGNLFWWHRKEDLVLGIVFAPANGSLGDLTLCVSPSAAEKLHPLLSSPTWVWILNWRSSVARAEANLSPTFYLGWLCELRSLPLGVKVFGGRLVTFSKLEHRESPWDFLRHFQQDFLKPTCYCSLVQSYPRKCLQRSAQWLRGLEKRVGSQ